jgi:hypothetical protein
LPLNGEPEMPRTINEENHRQCTSIPVPMIEEKDRIVREHPELHYNRQQFIQALNTDIQVRAQLLVSQRNHRELIEVWSKDC